MEPRRRIAVVAGAAAAVSGSTIVLVSRAHKVGLSSDFWLGLPVGLCVGLAILAILRFAKSKRSHD